MEELFRYYLSNIIILLFVSVQAYVIYGYALLGIARFLTEPFMKVVNRKKQQNYLILKMKCQIGHGDVALFFL